jgi:phosphoribosyl 1,2-cyclic phosphodiesterase
MAAPPVASSGRALHEASALRILAAADRRTLRQMKITFYGVRGSIPSPGPQTVRYGGNTSCVYVELANGDDLILDAGTGIRRLGDRLAGRRSPVNLFLSHGHWDHIQGYPFFAPIYQPDLQINVYTTAVGEHDQLCALFDQMDGANFPVRSDHLPSKARMIFHQSDTVISETSVRIVRQKLNHPGGGSAYRIEEEGASCAYVTDNELEPPRPGSTRYEEWVAFCEHVDVLIHDAQYEQSDMPHKHGWGHSLVTQVRQLARDAEVGCLVMYHHDPERTDLQIDRIQRENEAYFASLPWSLVSLCASEGTQIQLTSQGKAQRARIEVFPP